jgi:hypothetical protein
VLTSPLLLLSKTLLLLPYLQLLQKHVLLAAVEVGVMGSTAVASESTGAVLILVHRPELAVTCTYDGYMCRSHVSNAHIEVLRLNIIPYPSAESSRRCC